MSEMQQEIPLLSHGLICRQEGRFPATADGGGRVVVLPQNTRINHTLLLQLVHEIRVLGLHSFVHHMTQNYWCFSSGTRLYFTKEKQLGRVRWYLLKTSSSNKDTVPKGSICFTEYQLLHHTRPRKPHTCHVGYFQKNISLLIVLPLQLRWSRGQAIAPAMINL